MLVKRKTKGKEKDKRRREGKSEKAEHEAQKGKIPPGKGIVSAVVERVSENKDAIRYVMFFLSLCIAFYLVYYFLTIQGSLSLLKNITAFILGAIFSFVGAHVVVNGAALSINGFGLEIIDECTAVFASIVYCSSVLAYPTTLRNKGLGVLLGVPSLYAINILRLSVLALIGIFQPNLFEFVHVYLWQASFIIFVVVLFLLWLKLVEKV